MINYNLINNNHHLITTSNNNSNLNKISTNSSNSNNISAFLSYLLLNNRHLYNHYVNYLQSELSPKFDEPPDTRT